jgi:SsrA-binding protein
MKLIATKRRAKHDYQILNKFEAGIALKGSEVKAIKSRGCSIDESFARVEKEEVFLYNMHVPEFAASSIFKVDPNRPRKLLLHRQQIKKLIGATTQKSLTLIPLRIYVNQRNWIKIEVALARGRKTYDKRHKIKKEIQEKEAKRAIKDNYKKFL